MKVFKFGGASVNSASAVRNVCRIISQYADGNLFLVFSAMGKTTNALEKVVEAAYYHRPEFKDLVQQVYTYHLTIASELIQDSRHPVFQAVRQVFDRISVHATDTDRDFDEFYDRIVSEGEVLSTLIIHHFLLEQGLTNELIPARELVVTDQRFRDASVDWSETCRRIRAAVEKHRKNHHPLMLMTEGFIGTSKNGKPTTLGREGSDFTASLLAYCLDADEMTVWKDVDGLMNADPTIFPDSFKLDHVSYYDLIELAFYGAKILHPRTIKPLQNKSIPLRIRSFFKPESEGTLVDDTIEPVSVPFFIKKENQVLISFTARDFSFVTEDKLSRLFTALNSLHIKVNLMQNSAISFSIVIDDPQAKLEQLINMLKDEFDIRYNREVGLLTIRNYHDQMLPDLLKDKTVLLEQRSRKTIQITFR